MRYLLPLSLGGGCQRLLRPTLPLSFAFFRNALCAAHTSPAATKTFDKILVANRGEIACRVMKTARKMGIRTVAVYSDADARSMHAMMADEAYHIGPSPARESYLVGEKLLEVAKRSGAQAVHPGYGFLSENEEFAALCEKSGISFIGPYPESIRAMGSKSESKGIMIAANVPVVPGYHGEDQSIETLKAEASKIGFPLLIKATMGGGGKGMRVVEKMSSFDEALESAKREAQASFKDDRVLIEKYLTRPRHIEFQIFGDKLGNVVYLSERDCSVQRRHQKIIEEAPAPGMTQEMREKMGKAAVDAAKAVNYVGAGTVEFIVDEDGSFYFMEMNTRLQVEHPVTEMITGEDLVEWQIRVASGQPLPKKQKDIKFAGHSFETRIYAENPNNDFLPQTGTLLHMSVPPDCRIDTGVREGDSVSIFYDPMIAKLIVHAPDREHALKKLKMCLDEYQIVGLQTNIEFLKALCIHPAFIAGDVETHFIQKYNDDIFGAAALYVSESAQILGAAAQLQREMFSLRDKCNPAVAALEGFRVSGNEERDLQLICNDVKYNYRVKYIGDGAYQICVNGGSPKNLCLDEAGEKMMGSDKLRGFIDDKCVAADYVFHNDGYHLFFEGKYFEFRLPRVYYDESHQVDKGSLLSPMPGKIIKVLVKSGDSVDKDQPLIVLEAMKMEHVIKAPSNGVVEKINFNLGEMVEEKKVLVKFEPTEE